MRLSELIFTWFYTTYHKYVLERQLWHLVLTSKFHFWSSCHSLIDQGCLKNQVESKIRNASNILQHHGATSIDFYLHITNSHDLKRTHVPHLYHTKISNFVRSEERTIRSGVVRWYCVYHPLTSWFATCRHVLSLIESTTVSFARVTNILPVSFFNWVLWPCFHLKFATTLPYVAFFAIKVTPKVSLLLELVIARFFTYLRLSYIFASTSTFIITFRPISILCDDGMRLDSCSFHSFSLTKASLTQ